MRNSGHSIWAFLLTVFAAVGLAVAVLPGCGDDTSFDEPDVEESEPEPEDSSPVVD
jgi:hypothetical protein